MRQNTAFRPSPQSPKPAAMRVSPALPAVTLAILVSLTGCRTDADIQKDVDALIQRTLDNMVFVEGGSFMMGDFRDPESGLYHTWSADSKPAHKVTLDSYHIGKYEVTWGEYDLYTEINDLPRLLWDKDWEREAYDRQPEYPAGVSWPHARDYCLWLGKQTGLPFDLPTEAQWEYAARSRGKLVPFATDNGKIEEGRNYRRGGEDAYPVGSWPPNPLGLHDMSGNAREWIRDWYDPQYYSKSPALNPMGPEDGSHKVLRGGSYNESPSGSNVFARDEQPEEGWREDIPGWGFRCVINAADLSHID